VPRSFNSNLPSALPTLAAQRAADTHRRQLQRREKRGSSVGPTKRGKGSKIMAIADGHGFPLSVYVASASPRETKLVEPTLDQRFLVEAPKRMIGDRAYDSDPLDQRIHERYGVQLIAPHKFVRVAAATQDGRVLRRYRRRWKVERSFAWLHSYQKKVHCHGSGLTDCVNQYH
jgi:transposase